MMKSFRCNYAISTVLVTKCLLLIPFANSLDPNQFQQNVGCDLNKNYLDQDQAYLIHSEGILERIFQNGWFRKKISRRH